MPSLQSHDNLAKHIKPGEVYRRQTLSNYSLSIDRDLSRLTNDGVLQKVGRGLYYAPKPSRFGNLPPDDHQLIQAFLRDDQFLLVCWNDYNDLGLGLTQLYNRIVVYNRKRHGLFQLGYKQFDFRRPARGFPQTITQPFLVVDLMNNLDELIDEDIEAIQMNIKKLPSTLLKQAKAYSKQYGKIKTQRILTNLI